MKSTALSLLNSSISHKINHAALKPDVDSNRPQFIAPHGASNMADFVGKKSAHGEFL